MKTFEEFVEDLPKGSTKLPLNALLDMYAYATSHSKVGGFLEAVISNDLALSVQRADSENVVLLPQYAVVLRHCFPAEAWGSKKAYDRWTGRKEVAR